jgi:membrane protein
MAGNLVARVRGKRPALDHLIRAFGRYQAEGGDRLAAAVTYFAFLSFFPLLVLAFSVAGFLVDAYPSLRADLVEQINEFLPGLSDKLDVETIGQAKAGAGVLGLLGLLYAGLGWIDALRQALRTMWHHNVEVGNIVTRKLLDVVILAGLGVTLLASLAVSGFASAATDSLLDLANVETGTVGRTAVKLLGVGLAVLVDTVVFIYLFTRLPRLSTPFREVLKGAVLGAVGLELLKIVGAVLVQRTTNNPVYGAFAVVVGLLIWLNLVSRFTMFVAAWTVTQPYDSDTLPSGTATREAARAAGIPEEYADADPDHVPATVGGGAPAPLSAALQGRTPPQDEPDPAGDRRRGGTGGPGSPPAAGSAAAPDPRHDRVAVAAGRVGAGALLLTAGGVLVLGLKALRDSLRSS